MLYSTAIVDYSPQQVLWAMTLHNGASSYNSDNKYYEVINTMSKLSNVVVRLSSDSVLGDTIDIELPTSTIIRTLDDATGTMSVCYAYERKGKCGTCRSCWSKDVKTIAYVAHGVSMAKVIRLIDLKEVA